MFLNQISAVLTPPAQTCACSNDFVPITSTRSFFYGVRKANQAVILSHLFAGTCSAIWLSFNKTGINFL